MHTENRKLPFFGLDNARVLDLSNNKVNWSVELQTLLIENLRGDNILPNLSKLKLSNMKSQNVNTFFIDLYGLHSVLKDKPVKHLDFSGTNIRFYNSDHSSMLTHLEILNMSSSRTAMFVYILPAIFKMSQKCSRVCAH